MFMRNAITSEERNDFLGGKFASSAAGRARADAGRRGRRAGGGPRSLARRICNFDLSFIAIGRADKNRRASCTSVPWQWRSSPSPSVPARTASSRNAAGPPPARVRFFILTFLIAGLYSLSCAFSSVRGGGRDGSTHTIF